MNQDKRVTSSSLAEYIFDYINNGMILAIQQPFTRPPSDTRIWELLPAASSTLQDFLLAQFTGRATSSGDYWVFVRKNLNAPPPWHDELVSILCDELSQNDEVRVRLTCST